MRYWMVFGLLAVVSTCFAQEFTYQRPPAAITSVMESGAAPFLTVSPNKSSALVVTYDKYRSIAEMAQPFLRLAGVRLNPITRSSWAGRGVSETEILNLQTGESKPVLLPQTGKVGQFYWSPDGEQCALLVVTPTDTRFGLLTVSNAKLTLFPYKLSAGLSAPVQWLPDSKSLLLNLVDDSAGPAPERPAAPFGPEVQESLGSKRPMRTMPDALQDSFAESQFTYYMTSQLAVLDLASNKLRKIGKPGTLTADPSPDGNYLLIDEIHKPYSRKLYYNGFPHRISVLSLKNGRETVVADVGSEEGVPIEGVMTGPRRIEWKATSPSTLLWVEALDGGDPKAKADFRDRVVIMDAGSGSRSELAKLKDRFAGITWSPSGQGAVLTEMNYDTEHLLTYYLNDDGALSLLSDISERELYANPGRPITSPLPSGKSSLLQSGDWIYLEGEGARPTGDLPFLDRLNLKTGQKERLWQCDNDHYDRVVAVLDASASKVVTLRESPTEYPNFFLREPGSPTVVQLTHRANPNPELLGITEKLVKYKRADGVDLSFELYLPPDYKPGTKLPAIAEAYPLEYTDASTASQVSGTVKNFPTLRDHLLFLLAGYAVMSNVAMPIVGDPKTVNDTFVEQLCADADAAARAADSTGAIDIARMGVMGHSYGAFMTANLMAHSSVFRAGCAESGAYNRSLTPFGFQSERRTFWEAPQMYWKVSPFSYADQFKGPILLIHGQQDDNPGTYTVQSERLYQALIGNGAVTRLVLLPFEAHGYAAKESVEHVMWEELRWFDKYVKNADAR